MTKKAVDTSDKSSDKSDENEKSDLENVSKKEMDSASVEDWKKTPANPPNTLQEQQQSTFGLQYQPMMPGVMQTQMQPQMMSPFGMAPFGTAAGDASATMQIPVGDWQSLMNFVR